MVQTVGGTRKSVHLLDFCSLASKADLVLSGQSKRFYRVYSHFTVSLLPPLPSLFMSVSTFTCPGKQNSVILFSPLDVGFHHVAGHQLQPLLQMFSELGLRPVEVHHKHLQSIELPE